MASLPPPVDIRLDQTVREYWFERVRQHTLDSYAGVGCSKFPEDLRVYEHLIWASKPNVVIEIGAQEGGSTLWFRDRLRTLGTYVELPPPLVIALDVDISNAERNLSGADPAFRDTIALVEGDVRDPAVAEQVEARVPPGARCLVVEDSLHEYDTTRAALSAFWRFVPVGGFFVVEDGSVDVDAMRMASDWPRGVLPAVRDWLLTDEGSRFVVRDELELYGISCHPQGFIQRVKDDAQDERQQLTLPQPRLRAALELTVRQALEEVAVAEREVAAREHELRVTREALAAAEAELFALRDRRSQAMARMERQAYWPERAGIDLDALMRRRGARAALKLVRALVRAKRRLAGSRRS